AESFTVAAFDTCWTGNPPSPNTSATLSPHTTLYATTAYDRCAGEITVNWSGYVGWNVDYQELWVQQDGGVWALLTTLPPGNLSAQHDNVDPFSTYCYIVKAVEDGGPSHALSNKACRIADYPPVPQFNYLRTVTVTGSEEVVVVDSVDTGAQVQGYRLQRSFNGGPWQPMTTFPGAGGPVLQFTDADVLTTERSYQYRVLVDDSCGNEVLVSNLGNSVLLRAEAGLDGINRLSWNGYAGWAGNVGAYEVHRSVDDGPFQLLQVNSPLNWSWDDDVGALDQTGGRFCYYVLARETGNPSGIDAESMSNLACAIQEAQLWVPNAFIAGGVNDRFMPVTAFTDFVAYEFTIFNRWGQEIWTTGDPGMPWKGQVNGEYVPQGVYAWYC
ncbi:MAG: gliding motility-associated C-terminal domain-containing protein, partial [Flavobacteriales bacterium]|nr:gliding motility-associated C-terminal domain-containing protein [Flavobacteriales bacterium]